MILLLEKVDFNTQNDLTLPLYIPNESKIKWPDATLHVFSSLRYDATNGRWNQSCGFRLILGIQGLVYLKSGHISQCCFSANAIAILTSDH